MMDVNHSNDTYNDSALPPPPFIEAVQIEKIKISTQDELPRHTFAVQGDIKELFATPEAFAVFSSTVRKHLESDLLVYDITDKTTLKHIHETLMLLDMIEGHSKSALEHAAIIRGLEDKESARLMGSLAIEAHAAALNEVGGSMEGDNYKAIFSSNYAEKLNTMPWQVVTDEIKSRKGKMETLSRNLLYGVIDQYLQPMVNSTGMLNREGACIAVSTYYTLSRVLPVKDEIVAALQDYLKSHQDNKQDIWAERSIDLSQINAKLQPVHIAIWDSGVDATLFKNYSRLDVETEDSAEFDEHLHHIAHDMDWNRTQGLLAPMDGATRSVEKLHAYFKGIFDLNAALDTPESQIYKRKMHSLNQKDVKPFLEDISRYMAYSHGTHVCGIAFEGNPAARLITARLTCDPSMIPAIPTIEGASRAAAAFKEVVEFFKKNKVRVVNMSWVETRSSVEHALEVNGVGASAEERKLKAREMFDIFKKGLFEAISSAPEILFVGGAGNSNNDVAFDEFVPSMFKLDNLLIAGAVDQAGDPTSFTSFGPTVNIYSNGFEVESFVPGGKRLKLSGTSMAAPNVTNLAAKLFSLNSSLTPQQVVQLILEGSEERQKDGVVMRILHPKNSVALLLKQRNS